MLHLEAGEWLTLKENPRRLVGRSVGAANGHDGPGDSLIAVALSGLCGRDNQTLPVGPESSRVQSKCFIGLFVDISGFYDSVLWDSVIEEGLRLSFPPILNK